jgi:hypothetical protein
MGGDSLRSCRLRFLKLLPMTTMIRAWLLQCLCKSLRLQERRQSSLSKLPAKVWQLLAFSTLWFALYLATLILRPLERSWSVEEMVLSIGMAQMAARPLLAVARDHTTAHGLLRRTKCAVNKESSRFGCKGSLGFVSCNGSDFLQRQLVKCSVDFCNFNGPFWWLVWFRVWE